MTLQTRMITIPTFDIENSLNYKIIAGVDEAGRGPLCGPVVAAAVIIDRNKINNIPSINDSKKMSKKAREVAYDWITKNTIWATASASPNEIDEINILQASLLAMKRAIENLSQKPDFVLIDGNKMPKDVLGQAVVKGDAKSISIAAASILAKVTRDKIMTELATEFPKYGWDKNSGYPTKAHLAAIKKFGINDHYRKTFGPVKNLI